MTSAIDQTINQHFQPISDALASIIFYQINLAGHNVPLIVLWLIAGAVSCTLATGFINLRGFSHALRLLRQPAGNSPGEITRFQALSAALSGTVGTGNIAGVAVAITLGGPGATFWMIVAGLLGMSTKFVECTLAVKYRHIQADGHILGGPMYYIDHGLSQRGWPKVAKCLALLFAFATVMGSWGFVHVNQAYQQVHAVTGYSGAWQFGLVTALLIGAVIIGGIRSIAKVTSTLVPLMCGIYLIAALVILALNVTALPHAIALIVSQAFAPDAAYGGVIGVLIQGFRRAAFSNEAGIGSSPIAHATAKTDHPIEQGLVASLEPFIDTVLICTITALVIIVTGSYQHAGDGVAITSAAFASVFSWFPWVLMVALVLFGLSTVLTWSYYGLRGWTYLFGDTKFSEYSYKLLFCCVVAVGAVPNIYTVLNFIDAMVFLMALPNILVLLWLLPEVRSDLKQYLAGRQKS